MFGISIMALASLEVFFFTETNQFGDWKYALVHASKMAPIIGLGWFAARQYGFTARLRENYTYKVATSMTFYGYKRHADDAGEDVKLKLLNTAIDNFGENPLRIFNNHTNHASPRHELLDKIINCESDIKKLGDTITNVLKTPS